MKKPLIRILITTAFVVVIVISVFAYISTHRNEEASIQMDYSVLKDIFSGNKAYAYDRGAHLSSECDYTEQIIEISLEDGSSSVIYEITGSSLAIKNVKCFGDKAFFIVQKKDSTVKDSVPVKSFGLFAYSQTTGEATTISEKDLFDYYFTDDGNTFYYYVTGEGLYRSDISTEQTELKYDGEKFI